MVRAGKILGLIVVTIALLGVAPRYLFAAPSDGGTRTPASAFPAQSNDSSRALRSGLPIDENAPPFKAAESQFIQSKPRPVPPFPILLNRSVQQNVSEFLDQPDGLRLAFERSRPFFGEMVRVLKQQGLPDDLVYLAFAESEFSKRGKGPWQFKESTARRFGLHINRWVDERRDPIFSTRAAAEYLAELHDQADNDWRLALVGWNLGEGYLGEFSLIQGPNYNKFEHYLPLRTRQLLCRFMAVAFIAHNAVAYGIGPVSYAIPPVYRTLKVKAGTLLAALARKYRTTLAELRDLNPALLRDRVPPYARSYEIRVPLTMDVKASMEF